MSPEGAVTSVLFLFPKKANYAVVLEFFRTERILELSRESGGFLGASVNVPISHAGPILVIAMWRQEADYRRWVASSVRASFAPQLSELLERELVAGEMYSAAQELPA